MPVVHDFRNHPYSPARIERCGRHVGSKLYWKLYAIENTIRIVIHSVLTAQIHSNWWAVAVSPSVIKQASRRRATYVARPSNASPGVNDIHLILLSDLAEILRSNSHQFTPIVPDTNNWIAVLESIRVPRNLVGHMNFPNAFDKAAIDSAYLQLPSLFAHLSAHSVPVLIPK
jgi:hypothetical protein